MPPAHLTDGAVADRRRPHRAPWAMPPTLRARHPQARVHDYGQELISAGFIDAHVHYPQTAIIASWGKRLIDWLNTYTFPEEMRFADPRLCRRRSPTATSTSSWPAAPPPSAPMPRSTRPAWTPSSPPPKRAGCALFAGKTCMDRNAPEGLRDTAQSAYDDSKALLEKWHGLDRLSYVITPRFSPTSTPEQLAALGALWREYPDCLMQTHLSEQTDEIAWVRDLFPQSRDYLDTYEAQGLLPRRRRLRPRHPPDRPREGPPDRGRGQPRPLPDLEHLHRLGPLRHDASRRQPARRPCHRHRRRLVSFSMLRTMAAAYEVAQLRGQSLHPAQLWWLATQGSARALRAEDKIGNIAPGMEADLVVIDLASTPAIAQATARRRRPLAGAVPDDHDGRRPRHDAKSGWAAQRPLADLKPFTS